VFVVGYLGDWQRAAEVLFESESVCRNPAPSREKGQDAAKCLTAGVGKRYDFETETLPVAHTLRAQHDASEDGTGRGTSLVPIGFGAQMSVPQTDVDLMQTLQAKNPMAVAQPVPYDFYQITAPVNRQSRKPGDPCHTLARDNAAHATIVQPTYGIPGNWIGRQPENGGNAVEPMHNVSPCLTKTDRHGVAQPVPFRDPCPTLTAKMQGSSGWAPTNEDAHLVGVAHSSMQVRRLTPVECERLQGFPDNYTNIPWRKSAESPDGPRYKALGNSMAVPVMRWIGERIAKVDAK
jgi:DNA (cytosine-5)-methyltransferase 1